MGGAAQHDSDAEPPGPWLRHGPGGQARERGRAGYCVTRASLAPTPWGLRPCCLARRASAERAVLLAPAFDDSHVVPRACRQNLTLADSPAAPVRAPHTRRGRTTAIRTYPA